MLIAALPLLALGGNLRKVKHVARGTVSSQLSAGVADLIGAGGLIADASRRRVPVPLRSRSPACWRSPSSG